MAKITKCSEFMESYLKCRACGKHLICEFHSQWIKTLIKNKNCKPYKLNGCEACE